MSLLSLSNVKSRIVTGVIVEVLAGRIIFGVQTRPPSLRFSFFELARGVDSMGKKDPSEITEKSSSILNS